MKSEKYTPKVGEKLWLVHSDYRERGMIVRLKLLKSDVNTFISNCTAKKLNSI